GGPPRRGRPGARRGMPAATTRCPPGSPAGAGGAGAAQGGAVVTVLRTQRDRDSEMLDRVVQRPHAHVREAEAEVRIVVRGALLDVRGERVPRVLVASGVEQGTGQRLA